MVKLILETETENQRRHRTNNNASLGSQSLIEKSQFAYVNVCVNTQSQLYH